MRTRISRYLHQSQWLHPHSRPLTRGEKRLAQSVFGQALAVEQIRVYAARWVIKHYAISPNGHIYFHPQDWRPDFSTASLGIQAWFIHELVHVWQFQQGLKVVRKALFNRRYRYQLIAHRDFLSYGLEQQAQMVQDYFLNREQGKDYIHFLPFLPFQIAPSHQQSEPS